MTAAIGPQIGDAMTSPAATVPSLRDLDAARERADEAVREYARLAAEWNAPDHRHTAYQLRCLVECAAAWEATAGWPGAAWAAWAAWASAIREEVPNGRKL